MNEEIFHVGIKALVINNEGKVLLLKANPKMLIKGVAHWDLPGGRIKKGESITTTLEEELKEELGIEKNEVKIEKLFDASIANFKIPLEEGEVSLLLLGYICKIKPDAKIKISEEHTEVKWATAEEAKELLAFKFSKSFIEKLNELNPS